MQCHVNILLKSCKNNTFPRHQSDAGDVVTFRNVSSKKGLSTKKSLPERQG